MSEENPTPPEKAPGTWSLKWSVKQAALMKRAETRRLEKGMERSEYLRSLVEQDLNGASASPAEVIPAVVPPPPLVVSPPAPPLPPPEPVRPAPPPVAFERFEHVLRVELAAVAVVLARLAMEKPLTTEQVIDVVRRFYLEGTLRQEVVQEHEPLSE